MKCGLYENQDGMTLVELLAAMAIGLSLILVAGNVFLSSSDVFKELTQRREWSMEAEAIEAFLEKNLSFVSSVEVSQDILQEKDGFHYIQFTENGRVLLDGTAVYDEHFYDGNKITFTLTVPSKTGIEYVLAYSISVKTSKNKTFYSEKTVIQLVNLKLEGRSVLYHGDQGGVWDSNMGDIYLYYR